MSIATVVTRGYGSFGSVVFLPPLGFGAFTPFNVGPGRLEFTLPRSSTQFAMPNHRAQFTLPKTVEQYTEPTP